MPLTSLGLNEPTKTLGVVESNGIRRFDDANIQRAVDRAVASIPEGHQFAVVAHADLVGASMSVVIRPKEGSDWSVAVSCYKPYKGELAAEAKVVYSPF